MDIQKHKLPTFLDKACCGNAACHRPTYPSLTRMHCQELTAIAALESQLATATRRQSILQRERDEFIPWARWA